jgi:hypothetical protein
VLMRYLDMYLPRPDLYYDQPWAMAALQLACADAAQPIPGRYLRAWEQWRSVRANAGSTADSPTLPTSTPMLRQPNPITKRSRFAA